MMQCHGIDITGCNICGHGVTITANFFIMYFYVSCHFEYFYFLLIQQSFWSKIAEVSNKKKKEEKEKNYEV